MLHFYMHFTNNPNDFLMHSILNVITVALMWSDPKLFGKYTFAISSAITLCFAAGTYWIMQVWLGYGAPGSLPSYLDFVSIPGSVATSIFPSVFTCTIFYARQFGKKIGAWPLLFGLLLTVFFTFDDDVNKNKYILITEYWLYRFVSYPFLGAR
ncbi:hypothetical protein BNJ_00168 [Kaumoebavirus]|uniref:hypothetical protein n=1 Tax=Kaumoebavirus TaxID=1859492 RepID=UPI0009C32DA8|nr:hypothetical protein BNJ_00168 [Kaumoebavirus]ARA72000.1 hypothetical protein BNJ_00168 [Kaumoebavirus]